MNITKPILLLMAAALTGCEFQCSVGDKSNGTTTKTYSSQEGGGLAGAVIKNDIELEASGVKVSKTYLTNETDTPLDSNVVNLNEKINCFIIADTGWTKIDGQSYLGASERITGSDGTVLLDAKDLFEAYDSTGLSANDAKFVSLRARVSEKVPGIDSYTVQFKVWDKKGYGVITGKYKFRVR